MANGRQGTFAAYLGVGAEPPTLPLLTALVDALDIQGAAAFMQDWGVDMSLQARGGIEGIKAETPPSPREIFLCQRKVEGLGKNLGKTTGWIHRLGLIKRGVHMLAGCDYVRIDDEGLHLLVDKQPRLLAVDQVIICAGQEPLRDLVDGLEKPYHLIGGADVAAELDAKRAIDQGTRLAASL